MKHPLFPRFVALAALLLATVLSMLAFADPTILETKSHDARPCAARVQRFKTTPRVEGEGMNKVIVINDAVEALGTGQCGVGTEIAIGGGMRSLLKVIAITPTGERLEGDSRIALEGKPVQTIITQHQLKNETWEQTWNNVGITGGAAPSPTPDCQAKNAAGRFKLPSCAEDCQQKFWRWGFWVTNYNVDGSADFGQHQGIAVVGNEFIIDPRFPHADGKKGTWEREGAADYQKELAKPRNTTVEVAALCDSSQSNFRLIYNHGRTIALQAVAWDGYSTPPIKELRSITVGPVTHDKWSNTTDPASLRQKATTDCLLQIKDGFCDSVCGNCSSVIPSGFGATGTVDAKYEIKNQNTQFTVDETRHLVPSMTKYVQGKRPNSKDPMWGDVLGNPLYYLDPFTHCVSPAVTDPQQAVTSKIAISLGNKRVITGLFGHNSNTDAEAEFEHFLSCEKDPFVETRRPTSESPLACSACGQRETRNGKPIQFPCVMKSNTAASTWTRIEDLHSIDSEADRLGAGAAEGTPPICLTNGEPVKGM